MKGYIDIQGKSIAFYEKEGEGIPVVLLHGFCMDSRVWDDWLPLLGRHSTLRIDIGGLGATRWLPNSIEEQAQVVYEVLQALGITQCIMIGHSMGGYVALAYAKHYAATLCGVGLFHSHPFADSEEKKKAREKNMLYIGQSGHVLYVKQTLTSLFAPKFASDNAMLINQLIHNAALYPTAAIANCLEIMLQREDTTAVLRNLACPVLFIIGERDTTVPFEVSMQQTFLPPIADIHVLPQVAHVGMFEAPDQTAAIVSDFLAFCETMKHTV